ncbi:MAG: SDR family oxidoreductase [Myxococcales bacterium]|nr:SDR family oxidoreductase [Myxococcales bacterium]
MDLDEIFGLRGRVAVVVGASSGLGVECARALASAGADVALLARRKERLEALAEELGASGVRARAVMADATDDASLQLAIDEVEAELGGIWALVNSAGISRLSRALKHTREKWDQVLAVNLTAAFVMSQQVARKMVARGEPGRIVHVSSVLGRGASPVHPQVGYAAAKGGVDNLTRQLAIEWAPHGITVNAIAPGYFPTELTVDPSVGEMDADFVESIRRLTPMGRAGEPAEIQSALLYLTAPRSTYVTGSVIPVDGGWTAW